MKLKSVNPANQEIIGEIDVSTVTEVKEKVVLARKAGFNWKEMGAGKRVSLLKQVWEVFSKEKEEIALLQTKEMGMPISQAIFDTEAGLNYFKWNLENAETILAPEITYEDESSVHRVYREPLGVMAVIVPWNYPFSNFIWACVQNLIAGNTIVFKHAEETPLFGKRIEEVLTGQLPNGVFNEVYGDGTVGDTLVHQEIDGICFTGSTLVGRQIYRVAAEKFIKVILEMGGSAPGIVFGDADLDKAVEGVYLNRFSNCGQICDGLKRLLIHEDIYDTFVQKIIALVESKKVGDPKDRSTDIGPLVSEKQRDLLEVQVKDAIAKGAKVLRGGKRPKGLRGFYYEPTLLGNVKTKMKVWQEEVFGPVLPIVAFKSEEEAIKLANDTKYGLGSYIFTEDKERAERVAAGILAGMVSINNMSYLQPPSPFGGYKESGIGREHGKYGYYDLTQIKVVATEK